VVLWVEEGVLMNGIVVGETLQETSACGDGSCVWTVEEGLEVLFCCCPWILVVAGQVWAFLKVCVRE
jgi:hypothetical protein